MPSVCHTAMRASGAPTGSGGLDRLAPDPDRLSQPRGLIVAALMRELMPQPEAESFVRAREPWLLPTKRAGCKVHAYARISGSTLDRLETISRK